MSRSWYQHDHFSRRMDSVSDWAYKTPRSVALELHDPIISFIPFSPCPTDQQCRSFKLSGASRVLTRSTAHRRTHVAVFFPTPIEQIMSTHLDASSIARLSLHDPINFSIQHSQTLHRLALLQHWNIPPGSKVLELGCGQGDCTSVLANAVGEQGSVVAVDSAEIWVATFV